MSPFLHLAVVLVTLLGSGSRARADSRANPAAGVARSVGEAPADLVSYDTTFVRWVLVPDKSTARYRVGEQLAGLDLPGEAVGTTSQVSGSLLVAEDGRIDTQNSEFHVDLASITSDSERRDNYVRGRTLDVEEYPEAVLIPLRFLGLSFPLPSSGSVEFQMEGDLSLHGTTSTTVWAVRASVTPTSVSGVATTSFPFQSFNLVKPSVARVLSVDDTIYLELDFVMERESTEGGSRP